MRLVKKGEFFNNSFNIHKKARNKEYDHLSVIEDPQAPIDPTMQDDEASKWLAQQGVEAVPSEISQEPVTEQIPFNVDEWMDLWIKSNAEGISRENLDAIAADISLYREIKKHPEYQNILSEKINLSFPLIDKNKSDMFVQTMLAKAQGIIGEIEEKEKLMIEDEPFYKDKGESAVAQDVAKKVYDRFAKLSPEEQELVNNTMKMKYTPQMLSDAITRRFDDPGSLNKLDQRFNFFLYNPQFLEPFLQDASFAEMFNRAKTKNQKISVMKQEKGDDLINILSGLIDSLDPAVINWVKKGFAFMGKDPEAGKEITQTDFMPGDDEGRPMSLEGPKPQDWADLAITGADKAESLKFMSNAIKYYVDDNLEEMKDINEISSINIMDKAQEEFKKALDLSNIENKKITSIKKNNILNKYAVGERLNAYFKGYHDQILSLFDADGGVNKRDNNKVRYRNEDGFMDIPSDTMKSMLDIAKRYQEDKDNKDEFGKPIRVDIEDYRTYVNDYRKAIKDGEVKDPFKPDWKQMIQSHAVMRNVAELGEIKSKIFDLKDKKYTDPEGVVGSLSSGRDKRLLNRFANIKEPVIDKRTNQVIQPGDPESVIKKKRHDFVFMTLNQDKNASYSAIPLRAYKHQQELNGLKKEIDILDSELRSKYNSSKELKRYTKQREFNTRRSDLANSFKASIGTLYLPLLPKIADGMDQKIVDKKTGKPKDRFLSSSLFGFVELFDTHPTKLRNFLDIGQQVNKHDDLGRTNTELYYKVKGEEPPPHVQTLQNIYNRGIETGEIDKDQWYKELFGEYSKFDVYQRAYDRKKEREDVLRKKLNDKVQKVNDKVLSVVRANDNGIAFQKVLNKIKDPAKQIEIQNYMSQWDGISQLPLEYYGLFGQKKTKDVIEKDQAAINKILEGPKGVKRIRSGEEGLNDIKRNFEKQKIDLRNKLKERNLDVDLSALRIAEAMYRIVQNKILKLSKIKESGYKFASVNTLEIDKSIESIKYNFDKLFMSLFS